MALLNMMKRKGRSLESETKTPKEWVDEDKRCHICDLPLNMSEWGDWGHCGNFEHPIWNMFIKDEGE